MSTPLVSIVMCTYNGEAYLQQQLASIALQTYPNLEIICSDNNSSDATPIILQNWCAGNPNRKFISNKEKGLNKNFYSAIPHATGDYVSFSDQDDVWDPKKIEKLVAFYEANKDASMVYCLSKSFEGEIKEPLAEVKHGIRRLEGSEIRNTMLVSFTLGHNLLIKRSVLAQLPVPANEVIAYDWWITVSAMCKGPIKCLHEELTYWRQHPANTTKVLNEDLFHISRAKYLAAFATNPLISEKDKLWIEALRMAFITLTDKRFSPALFRLLLANAPQVFFYKRKKNPVGKWISYAKWAYRMSKHDYRP